MDFSNNFLRTLCSHFTEIFKLGQTEPHTNTQNHTQPRTKPKTKPT